VGELPDERAPRKGSSSPHHDQGSPVEVVQHERFPPCPYVRTGRPSPRIWSTGSSRRCRQAPCGQPVAIMTDLPPPIPDGLPLFERLGILPGCRHPWVVILWTTGPRNRRRVDSVAYNVQRGAPMCEFCHSTGRQKVVPPGRNTPRTC